MRFYLGTHKPRWLEGGSVPLFVSRTELERMGEALPRAAVPWALDSGGFTQLNRPPHKWTISAEDYAATVDRYAQEVGMLEWAAPQDWMCEPWIVEATGLSVREHQERTVANYLDLRGRGPFIPVLQGWTLADYHACVELYANAGVDLRTEPLVGLGSVCRRQQTEEIARIVWSLHGEGLRLHGFGVKSRGFDRYAMGLTSADSMAWSVRARWSSLEKYGRGTCGNCQLAALAWRQRMLRRVPLRLC